MQSAPAIQCPIIPSVNLSPKLKPSSFPLSHRRKPHRNLCCLTTVHSSRRSAPQPPNSYPVLEEFRSSVGLAAFVNNNPREETDAAGDWSEEIAELGFREHGGIFANMWWPDFRAAFGQRVNVEGIVCAARVLFKDRHLALPHVAVPDIRYIDWVELRRRGFKGVVFDKDNTITVPYSLTLWAPLRSSMEECKSVFGNDVAVFSNSAGLLEYDYDGSKAMALERAIGIKVIRHRVKKPAGTAEEIEKNFGCTSSQLIMVGDRPFTDIVYGNQNGFLTILTKPLSSADEPFIVRQVRKLEMALMNYWLRRGFKPPSHRLLPDPMDCVKDNPSVS